MREIFKQLLIDLLGQIKVFPTASTNKRDIALFLKKLFPVLTDKELIRFGPRGDGGYLIPNDLAGIEACFSPGVEYISGFEKNCAELGMQVFLADKSIDMPEMPHEKFQFIQKHIGVISSDDFMTIDEWVNASLPGSKSDLLLQIDIESFEYETFIGMSDPLLHRFRIIVAEFHGLHYLGSLPFFNLASRAFEKILKNHVCVHIHPNNRAPWYKIQKFDIPAVLEFTFLRKDRINHSTPAKIFPHPLDCDNAEKKSLLLPQCWYGE